MYLKWLVKNGFYGVMLIFMTHCDRKIYEDYGSRLEYLLKKTPLKETLSINDTVDILFVNTMGCLTCKNEELERLNDLQTKFKDLYLLYSIPEDEKGQVQVKYLLHQWRQKEHGIAIPYEKIKNSGLILGSHFYARLVKQQVVKFTLRPWE
jgi:hypothetical protein